jgi:hypothetical protein
VQRVPATSDSALTSSMVSISPVDGQLAQSMVPEVPEPLVRKPAPSAAAVIMMD